MLLLLFPREGEPCFIAPQLYEDQLRRDTPVVDLRIWHDGEDPTRVLRDALREKAPRARRVLVEDRMWASSLLSLLAARPDVQVDLASTVLAELRVRKDDEELELLRRAAAIVDETFEWVCGERIAGMTELELAGAIEAEMRQRGAEGIAFETLVASGPNGALPHHRAGSREIRRGDVVILDYGCRVGGYHSDITRTVVCGRPEEDEVSEVYQRVREAQRRAVAAVCSGVPAQAIDRTARSLISESGYGERFIHRTGHGIGLEVHEPPYIVEGNVRPLEAGMTFSVEPGVYLPGRFGIRIEDIVAVTPQGVESLNRCGHELRMLS